ncbi:hypothetical protein RQP53_15290 [Paucibacter sp. APW11]|uniref:Outer membrane lipoprotein carrier protein LolA n=1 Tax=Roseateles aquae TaxID=3077235 RepID=A0ABU3PDG1_9BURK|nr:DUF6882 domain-containing protein [Paucibacter sp. APW11]MDT9000638.1 hypothetical protein [Paucibacter sp. APW11]
MKLIATLLFAAAQLVCSSLASAQTNPAIEQVFGQPLAGDSIAWIDDAVEKFNEAMTKLRSDWLAEASSTRIDSRRRKIVFEVPGGKLLFDAKVIGTMQPEDGAWLWIWGWGNPTVASNFRLPGAELSALADRLGLPLLATTRSSVPSPELPLFLGAIVMKLHGGSGVHRVRVKLETMVRARDIDVYYLLSNPQRVSTD